MHDLFMDSLNNINIEKSIDFGSSISKKYFEFENYYIVVSENNRTDFNKNYNNNYNDEKKNEQFILFEAIRKSTKFPLDNDIIKRFLNERFKINIRIPYKYIIKIDNQSIINKFNNCVKFIDDDSITARLTISDDINVFFNNQKVKEFYGKESESNCLLKKNDGLSSSLIANYRNNTFNEENVMDGLTLNDSSSDSPHHNFFLPNFKSILIYFFGQKFELDNINLYYFYFKGNKIILYFVSSVNRKRTSYLCIISFQEIVTKKKLLRIFVDLIASQNIKSQDNKTDENRKIKIYKLTRDNYWEYTNCSPRLYETIYLPLKIKKLIISEMDKFICFEKVFSANGIPYKKGFLFYGPPGTGKTSLVKSLAHIYDIPIYIFDINNENINDENIGATINAISGSGNKILLFEDIDTAFADKEELTYQVRNNVKKSIKDDSTITSCTKKYLTYSGLLNALDGVTSGNHGLIIIMTTNYYEKLGPALIRPGRIDFTLELSYCDYFQLTNMTKNLIVKSYDIISKESIIRQSKLLFIQPYDETELDIKIEKFANDLLQGCEISLVKPCELQVYILKYIENVENIFINYKELLKD